MKNIRVASPCPATWESMRGDERVRHCTVCSLNVYNFAELTRDEIRELVIRTEGRLCARLYRRADGTLLTRDCPSGLQALRQRISRLATAVFAAFVSLSAFASGGAACEKPRPAKENSKIELEVERTVASYEAVFKGVVLYAGAPLPGVRVVLRNEALEQETAAVTDANGNFLVAPSDAGLYCVEVTFPDVEPVTIEHIVLKPGEVTTARVTLQLDSTATTITVGVIAVEPMMSKHGMATTYYKDLIDKLPI